MDGIYCVYGMLARLVVCITALVGTWSALNRVYMGYGTAGVSVSLSCRPPVRTPLSAFLHSSHESIDGIYYVYGMLARLVVCITALVGTWSALNRVNMGYGTVGVSVSPSAHPFLPCTVATSLWMVSTMFMGC